MMIQLFCRLLLILIIALPAATPAMANWRGGIEGGTVFRDNGSATRLRLKLTNPQRPLSHYVYADWLRGESGENSYEAGYLPRYWFDTSLYAFGEASLRVDNPLSIERQRRVALGVGYQLISSRDRFLRLEAGAGQQRTDFLNSSESDDTFALLRAGFNQVLNDLLRLELDLNHLDGERLAQTTAEASIALRIPSGAVKFGYRTRRLRPDNGSAVEENDSFVSYSFRF